MTRHDTCHVGLSELVAERDALRALCNDLAGALYDARDRMFGNGPVITALRVRTDAALAKLEEARAQGVLP